MGLFDSVGGAGNSLFTDRWGSPKWWVWVGLGVVIGLVLITIFHFLPDYGQCLKGHSEPRHTDAWLEMRSVENCNHNGKHCTTTIYPVFHPSEDWTVFVCDQYEFPDGDGREQRKRRNER